MRNIYLAAVLVVIWLCSADAQEWSQGNMIGYFNPPMSPCGVFDPAFGDADSLLYFDLGVRGGFDFGEIYITHFDSFLYDYSVWSDPVLLPEPINIADYCSGMAAPSRGGDTLFFVSNRPGSHGGLDIWYSAKIDNQWQEPVNLGDSINTAGDELSPHYISETGELYFDRREPPLGYAIYHSVYSEGSGWQIATRLPLIINSADNYNYSPYYDIAAATLYFDRVDAIYKSEKVGGEWQLPQNLGHNVNGDWLGPYADLVATERPWLGFDGRFLFYSKLYTEEDPWSALYFSEKLTSIEEQTLNAEQLALDLSIYPNPSNTSFKMTVLKSNRPYDLIIYNMLGEVVRQYINCSASTIIWDGTDSHNQPVASGVYLAKIVADDRAVTKKLVLQK